MPVILFKPIRQKKFNDKAFIKAFDQAAKETADGIERDYRDTTAGWKRKPKFTKIVQVGPRSVEVLVGTDNPIYGYVDLGTRPHLILPKRARVLRWVGKGYSGKGRPSKSNYVFAKYAFHPGFKGYKHTERIQGIWQKKFKRNVEQAMRIGRSECGHPA